MTSDKIIEIRNLNKSFKEVRAVQDLSFSVRRGELFAFLGVNGAGKSTTISIMCGKIAKDSGSVTINGADADSAPAAVKSSLGVVFQGSALDRHLSVYDNLQSRAALYGITGERFKQRYEELSALLHFSDLSKRTLGKLSGGQRRRIDVARALLHRPEILILDEPTTGLDPQTRKLLWRIISDLRKNEGLTVFLTTHYMEEAADADYVVILDGGRKVAEGTPQDLKNAFTNDYINVYGRDMDEITALGYPCAEVGGAIRISVPDTAHAAELIAEHRSIFTDFEIFKGNMDDVFLAVTGKQLAEGETI